MIETIALLVLTVMLGTAALAYLTHRQGRNLQPAQQQYAFKMPETDAKRLIQNAQTLNRGQPAETVIEKLGKPNLIVQRPAVSNDSELANPQDFYYVLASRGPVVPYQFNTADTCVVISIGPDRKLTSIRYLNVTGAVPGMRSDGY